MIKVCHAADCKKTHKLNLARMRLQCAPHSLMAQWPQPQHRSFVLLYWSLLGAELHQDASHPESPVPCRVTLPRLVLSRAPQSTAPVGHCWSLWVHGAVMWGWGGVTEWWHKTLRTIEHASNHRTIAMMREIGATVRPQRPK